MESATDHLHSNKMLFVINTVQLAMIYWYRAAPRIQRFYPLIQRRQLLGLLVFYYYIIIAGETTHHVLIKKQATFDFYST